MTSDDGVVVRGRRGRRLTAEEQALWDTVTRAVKPMRPRPAVETTVAASPPPEPVPPARPASAPARAALPESAAPAPVQNKPAGLDRRLKQRVGRGAMPIEARLDLHGMTQIDAHAELLRFLRVAQAKQAKLVLVITGKGARGGAAAFSSERGVLKRLVPQWLSLPEFRAYVIGFDAAHASHGGEGALYVRVRRAR
jgi:DNA-nicking Smr family endonuclease